jgi:hypothetical protein
MTDGWDVASVERLAGAGCGGQQLFIVLDRAVLVHSGLCRSSIQGAVPLMGLKRYVLPAVKEP